MPAMNLIFLYAPRISENFKCRFLTLVNEVVFEFLGLHYVHIQSLEFLGFEFLGLHYIHMKLGLNFLVIWFEFTWANHHIK